MPFPREEVKATVDRYHELRQRIVQRIPIDLERTALAALALIENNSILVTSKSRAQVRPTPVRGGGFPRCQLEVAAEEADQRLQFLQRLYARV